MGGVKQGRVGKQAIFLDLNVNISKTVADTAKITISDYQEVTPGLSIDTKDDPELL